VLFRVAQRIVFALAPSSQTRVIAVQFFSNKISSTDNTPKTNNKLTAA
jgi:hypothetical protein